MAKAMVFVYKRPIFCQDCLKGLDRAIIINTLLPYLSVDLVKQGEQKGVEVSQEEGKDAPELPLEGDPRMVILKLGDGLKQRRTHQTEKRHDDLQLSKTVQNTNNYFTLNNNNPQETTPIYLFVFVFLF